MRLEHHLVGGYVRYISPHIIIIIIIRLHACLPNATTITRDAHSTFVLTRNSTPEQYMPNWECSLILCQLDN